MKDQKGKYMIWDLEARVAIPLILLTIFLILLVGCVCVTALALEYNNDRETLEANSLISSQAITDPTLCTLATEPVLEDARVFFVDTVHTAFDQFDPDLDLVPLSYGEMEESEEALAPAQDVSQTEDLEILHTTRASDEAVVEYVLKASSDSRYAGLKFTQEDIDLLIDIMWLEARGEPSDGRRAAVEVIFNRMVNEQYFPDTLYEVIYDTENTVQFPTIYELHMATPTKGESVIYLKEIKEALNGPYILPIDVVFFRTEAENKNIWGTIGGHTFCYPWDWERPAETEPNQGSESDSCYSDAGD